MNRIWKVASAAAVLFIVIAACSFSAPTPQPAVDNKALIETQVKGTLDAWQAQPAATSTNTSIPLPTPTQSYLLPRRIYYLLSGGDGLDQVWKLDRDGISTHQVTNTTAGVKQYNVSLATGALAYVSDNDLFIQQSPASAPVKLIDGTPDDKSDTWYATQGIGYPVWAPDGMSLAFYQAGLSIYHMADGSVDRLLENQLQTGDFTIIKEMYYPILWSPDGSRLVVGVSYYEAGTMGVYNLAGKSLLKLQRGDGQMVCCNPAFSADGRTIYFAGFGYGSTTSELWSYDADTGNSVPLLSEKNSNGNYNFAQYPFVAAGQLYFLYSSLADYPVSYQSASLATSPVIYPATPSLLRQDSQSYNEAIWADDASMMIGVQIINPDAMTYPYYGPLVLLKPGNEAINTLLPRAKDISWGD